MNELGIELCAKIEHYLNESSKKTYKLNEEEYNALKFLAGLLLKHLEVLIDYEDKRN